MSISEEKEATYIQHQLNWLLGETVTLHVLIYESNAFLDIGWDHTI